MSILSGIIFCIFVTTIAAFIYGVSDYFIRRMERSGDHMIENTPSEMPDEIFAGTFLDGERGWHWSEATVGITGFTRYIRAESNQSVSEESLTDEEIIAKMTAVGTEFYSWLNSFGAEKHARGIKRVREIVTQNPNHVTKPCESLHEMRRVIRETAEALERLSVQTWGTPEGWYKSFAERVLTKPENAAVIAKARGE